MGAFHRQLADWERRIMAIKAEAREVLARTTDTLERTACESVQMPLNEALVALDMEARQIEDAAEQARREQVTYLKRIREFPPEIASMMFRPMSTCVGCQRTRWCGTTSGLCELCWTKAGMP
jgi:hypothetical protein